MKNTFAILLLLLFTSAMHSCYYDKEQLLHPASGSSCTGVAATFTTDVNPIIQSSCANGAGCHGNGSTNGPGPLTTYDQVKAAGTQILNSVQAGRMPIGSSLSASQIQSISCWLGNGSINN